MATILVVEGYEGTRSELKASLEGEGHRVLTADSPTQGLKLWQEHRKDIDLVLTAKSTNDDDNAGLTLTKALRVLRSDVPVIMQSDTSTSPEEVRRFTQAGSPAAEGKNIFLRSISLDLLLPAIEKCLTAPVHTR
jgi:CheY-like chemotaxis protein